MAHSTSGRGRPGAKREQGGEEEEGCYDNRAIRDLIAEINGANKKDIELYMYKKKH